MYELDKGEGLVLVLDLDETPFDLGTNYDLDCETAEQAGGDEDGSGAVRACRCGRVRQWDDCLD